MRIEVIQKINKEYFREYYSEWLIHRSKYRKWEAKIGFCFLAIALITYVLDKDKKYLSLPLFLFGLIRIYDYYATRYFWLKDRIKSKSNNIEQKVIFENNTVEFIGPFSQSKGLINSFEKIIETDKGVFFIIKKGESLYLQKKIFKTDIELQYLVEQIRGYN